MLAMGMTAAPLRDSDRIAYLRDTLQFNDLMIKNERLESRIDRLIKRNQNLNWLIPITSVTFVCVGLVIGYIAGHIL
jgi:hypothetical protein